jgi:hypothetical protein
VEGNRPLPQFPFLSPAIDLAIVTAPTFLAKSRIALRLRTSGAGTGGLVASRNEEIPPWPDGRSRQKRCAIAAGSSQRNYELAKRGRTAGFVERDLYVTRIELVARICG